jgi:hypothetical protein
MRAHERAAGSTLQNCNRRHRGVSWENVVPIIYADAILTGIVFLIIVK